MVINLSKVMLLEQGIEGIYWGLPCVCVVESTVQAIGWLLYSVYGV